MITYLLQLTLCWGLFYVAYYYFLREETHFKYNRTYLLLALSLALIIPLVDWGVVFIHEPESFGQLYITPLNIQIAEWDITVQAAPQVINEAFNISWYEVVMSIYLMGCLIAATQLIRGWLEILAIRRRSEMFNRDGYSLVLTNQSIMPFSFLGSIYCFRDFYRESPDIDQVLAHEKYHIKAHHSLDVIFLELLKVVFWFHPLVYIYKNELQQIHEYQADHAAYVLSTKKAYGKLLLNHADYGMPAVLANPFFNSQLKNRFKMMTKKPSTRKTMLKYLVIFPVVAMAVLMFSYTSQGESLPMINKVQQDTLLPPPPPAPPLPGIGEEMSMGQNKYVVSESDLLYVNGRRVGFLTQQLIDEYSANGPWIFEVFTAKAAKERIDPGINVNVYSIRKKVPGLDAVNKTYNPNDKKGGEIFRVVEQMPRFPGCDELEGNAKQKKSCADRKMMEFLYKNIQYPAVARDSNIDGTVVVSFIVEKDGSITNPTTLRTPGAGLGEEAVRIVQMMSDLPEKWTPGVQKGEEVRVQFILPVKFELIDKNNNGETAINPPPPPPPPPVQIKGQEEVFRVVEQMPRFPGCEEVEGNAQKKKSCADRKMLEFIYKNVRYPAAARKNGIEGGVVVSFIIEKDGSITDPKVIRTPGAGLGDEAVRVVNMMSDMPEKWTPGVQRGHKVRVQFILPVKFELGTKNENQDKETKALLVIDDEILGKVDLESMRESVKMNDVVSVNILKGESGTKKYGDKGSDGVIEITTKWHKEVGANTTNLDLTDVKIYPVPAENQLNVEASVENNGPYRIEVRDLKGSVVLEREIDVSARTLRTNLDLNGLVSGPYYLMVLHRGKVFSRTFVKQ